MSLSLSLCIYICTYVYKYTYSLIALNWTIGGIHSEIQIFGLKRLQGNGYGEWFIWFIFDENRGPEVDQDLEAQQPLLQWGMGQN